MDLTNDEADLLFNLRALHDKLRAQSLAIHRRLNPFCEDLFDWKERGKYWTKRDGVTIYNSATIVGDVDIGANTWIGPFCSLDGTAGIRIGSNCSLSVAAQVVTHDTVKWCLSGGTQPYEYAPVTIGNNCFIGVHAIILKGVTIGDCCVVGAGAVVTSDIPAHTIVGGVPARTLGHVEYDANGQVKLVF